MSSGLPQSSSLNIPTPSNVSCRTPSSAEVVVVVVVVVVDWRKGNRRPTPDLLGRRLCLASYKQACSTSLHYPPAMPDHLSTVTYSQYGSEMITHSVEAIRQIVIMGIRLARALTEKATILPVMKMRTTACLPWLPKRCSHGCSRNISGLIRASRRECDAQIPSR